MRSRSIAVIAPTHYAVKSEELASDAVFAHHRDTPDYSNCTHRTTNLYLSVAISVVCVVHSQYTYCVMLTTLQALVARLLFPACQNERR